jgi:hypothetical protein
VGAFVFNDYENQPYTPGSHALYPRCSPQSLTLKATRLPRDP